MTDDDDHLHPLPRVPTGIAGLDTVLAGGVLRGGLYRAVGPAGAGKTILGNQLCFHHVATGGRAAYITLLAETHGRLLAHLRPLAFFDHAVVGATLHYYSASHEIARAGLTGLLDYLRGVLRDDKVTLLVLDGLGPVHAVASADIDVRQFLAALHAEADARGCTTLLLAPAAPPDPDDPTDMMVDGIIALDRRRVGARAIRELDVRKFRGSGYLEGGHDYAITDAGLVVHPRTEAVFARPSREIAEDHTRRAFAIPGLDAMLHGGLPASSTTMLLGPSGSGKSLLGLHFLVAGARAGEPGVYFGFYEAPARLVGTAESVGLALGDHVRGGRIALVWQPPLEQSIDLLAERLLTTVQEHGAHRLVIDGLDGFVRAAVDQERIGRFFSALTNELRARGVTTLFSVELLAIAGPTVEVPIPGVSLLSENMLFLRAVEVQGQLQRLLSILKVRESDYDPAIRAFRITDRGIAVDAAVGTAAALLTGTARPATRAGDAAPEASAGDAGPAS